MSLNYQSGFTIGDPVVPMPYIGDFPPVQSEHMTWHPCQNRMCFCTGACRRPAPRRITITIEGSA